MAREHSAANLFEQKPTICFYPQVSGCAGDLKVLKSREKTVVTMDIGAFRAKETILQDAGGGIHHCEQLSNLAPHRCTFGYDVLVHVGYALFVHGRTEQQIVAHLAERNVTISARQIGNLGKKFIAYLAIAHHQSRRQLRQAMAARGGYILHIDGTCEADSPHLFTGIDGIAQLVLDNVKLPSEKAALLIPFLDRIKRQYGDPIALVHDMGKGILSAVEAVFPGVPDFICHFHFLRDIGKDLFENEYGTIRSRLKKHKIRALLRQKLRSLQQTVDDDRQLVCALANGIEAGGLDPEMMEKMPALATYAMIHWALDTSQFDGCGFPFDCPHFIFYQRLRVLYRMVNKRLIRNKVLSRLWGPLTKIVEDRQLEKAAKSMDKKLETFNKLREALCIAVAQTNQGLNDDGAQVDMQSIAEKVKRFRDDTMADKGYGKLIEQIDKYWDKLFADTITVTTSAGQLKIQPQRTNNILERFFRDLKRKYRKRSGTVSLSKALKFILADTALVKNLDNPEYVQILLDGCGTLQERFAKIESHLVAEQLKAERNQQERIRPEMKKLIQRPDLPQRLTLLLAGRQY